MVDRQQIRKGIFITADGGRVHTPRSTAPQVGEFMVVDAPVPAGAKVFRERFPAMSDVCDAADRAHLEEISKLAEERAGLAAKMKALQAKIDELRRHK